MDDADSDLEDLFYVLLPDDQVATLSLDELDEAFQQDRIADTTRICRVGDTKWVTLAELASLYDEPQPERAAPSAPVYVAPMTPPAAYVPADRAVTARSFAAAPVSRPPDSMAPLASDLALGLDDDLDPDLLALRPKRRALWAVSAIAAVGIAGVAALVSVAGAVGATPGAAQAAALMKPPAMAAAAPAPKPVETAPAAAAPAAQPSAPPPVASDAFSEDMKRALLEADAKREVKKGVAAKKSGKARKAKPARAKAKSKRKSKSKGNAYDPLNGSL
jgi:hypothetical protein